MADSERTQGGRGRFQSQDELIGTHGGFRNLMSFQVAQLAYDVTVRFCDRYIDKRSRTHDQMTQAARSGVQNIAEGSIASGTSKKMELKLTSIARASLGELQLDYEDFLRQRGMALWKPNDSRRKDLVTRRCCAADEVAAWVKEVAFRDYGLNGHDGQKTNKECGGNLENKTEPCEDNSDNDDNSKQSIQSKQPIQSISSIQSIQSINNRTNKTDGHNRKIISSIYAEVSANAAHVLIGVAMSLLDRQINALATAFESEGGFTERMYRVRQNKRRNK